MAKTERITRWYDVSHGGTNIEKVTDIGVGVAATIEATAEDDDVYMTGQFAQDLLVTGSITSNDVGLFDAVDPGDNGTLLATGRDEDGTTKHLFTVVNCLLGDKVLTGPRGWSSYVINWQAVSADGSTSPITISNPA